MNRTVKISQQLFQHVNGKFQATVTDTTAPPPIESLSKNPGRNFSKQGCLLS